MHFDFFLSILSESTYIKPKQKHISTSCKMQEVEMSWLCRMIIMGSFALVNTVAKMPSIVYTPNKKRKQAKKC